MSLHVTGKLGPSDWGSPKRKLNSKQYFVQQKLTIFSVVTCSTIILGEVIGCCLPPSCIRIFYSESQQCRWKTWNLRFRLSPKLRYKTNGFFSTMLPILTSIIIHFWLLLCATIFAARFSKWSTWIDINNVEFQNKCTYLHMYS